MTSCPKLKDLRCTYPHCPCMSMREQEWREYDSITELMISYCYKNGVKMSQIIGRNRKPWLVEHRARIAKKARENGFTFEHIGEAMDRHYSTIIHLVNK